MKCKGVSFKYLNILIYSNLSLLVRYSQCSLRFADAYQHGLAEKEAAWAGKKYCGHHCMPTTLMEDMEKEGLKLIQTIDLYFNIPIHSFPNSFV